MPGWNGIADFFAQEGGPVIGVAIASLLYQLVDLFIVIKGFKAVFRAPSFWLLWFCTFILNVLAFEALSRTQAASPPVFGAAQTLALVVMSTLGTAVILQSFTFKIGDRKVVDISKIMDDFRATVLEDISRQTAIAEQKFTRRTAEKLYRAFQGNPQDLRNQFVNVMSFAGRAPAQLQADLSRLDQDAQTLGVPPAMLLAQRIAQADVREAYRLAMHAELAPSKKP